MSTAPMSPPPMSTRQRQPLHAMLVDLLTGVSLPPRSMPGEMHLRLSSVWMDLPIEVRFEQTGEEVLLLADLPRWRWTTDFDDPRGRLRVLCGEGDPL